ncbi:MAG: DNA repair protein RecO [Acidobacteriota bacterium]
MSLLTSEAVVLRVYPLGEFDRIVVLYTRLLGKIRSVAKGARRVRNRFSGCLEPFSWIEFVGFEKPGQELVRLDRAELRTAFALGIPDYETFLRFNLVAELVLKTVPDHEPNDSLFRLIPQVFSEMRVAGRSRLAQLYFQIWHLRLSGFLPQSLNCGACAGRLDKSMSVRLDIPRSVFLCPRCATGGPLLSGASVALWRSVLCRPVSQVGQGEVSERAYSEIGEVMRALSVQAFEREFECLELIREASL